MENTAQKEDQFPQTRPDGALARATAWIARDAEVEPARYLEESLVPKGGE